jgi:endoglucanase
MLVVTLLLAAGALLLVLRTDDEDGGGGGRAAASAPGGAGAVARGAVAEAGRRFLDTYVEPDGRVERTDQGGDTVGEGQAYGMLVAAAIGDERRFDRIWRWTQDELQRDDGLIAFLWRDGKVADPKPASDADVDAARALLTASCRFDRPELQDDALALGDAILAHETNATAFGDEPLLVAGPWARRNPVVVNPSYFSPATFAELGRVTGDGRWAQLAASGRQVTNQLMPDEGDLPPDWAVIRRGEAVASGPPASPEDDPAYGFDAVRTLVRYAEDPEREGREIPARAWSAFEGRQPGQIPVEWKLNGTPAGTTQHPSALVAAAAAAAAAGDTASKARLLDAAEALDRRQSTYYGSAWVALGRIMLDTRALDCEQP